MPVVRTNPLDEHEGHLVCDWPGCSASSPTLRMQLGPLPVEGWHGVPRRAPMRSVVEYFCTEHVEPGTRQGAPGQSVDVPDITESFSRG